MSEFKSALQDIVDDVIDALEAEAQYGKMLTQKSEQAVIEKDRIALIAEADGVRHCAARVGKAVVMGLVKASEVAGK